VEHGGDPDDQHYVTFKTDVVGVQYYRGLVGKGEMVMLRRQPDNQYDPNAVQVSYSHAIIHRPAD
jgi:SWI/SNF-related matrix-associated actin-dependent regulator of chromatin subfamily A3